MNPRKHRHKESFSVLLISNTGQNTRHFHVTRSFLRFFTVFVLCVCGVFGWITYQYLSSNEITSDYVNASESEVTQEVDQELINQIAEQEKLVQQLEEENDALNRRNNELTSENKALLAIAKTNMETATVNEAESEDDLEADPAYPSRYPYSESGNVSEKYSESHPYVSIDTDVEGGDVVAAGEGTVTLIGSDDTYPLIIEIDHGNGYRTRYMFLQDAEPLQEEGTQVQSGTALVSVDINNVQLDYQVIYEDKPIDPLIVFEAKG